MRTIIICVFQYLQPASCPANAGSTSQPDYLTICWEYLLSYIRNRKHAAARQPLLTPSLLALAAFGLPAAAHAQAGKDTKLPEISVKAAAEVPFKADKVSSPKITQPLVDTTQT